VLFRSLQVPHVELTREIARRFNGFYGVVFREPQALLTPAPRLPGTDGRKMSKSYDNAIFLSDPPEIVSKKLATMITDPARKRRTDKGNPDVCPVFDLHKVFSSPTDRAEIDPKCRSADIGCLDCKQILAGHINKSLKPIQEQRAKYEKTPGEVWKILDEGTERARKEAQTTMREVREKMHLTQHE